MHPALLLVHPALIVKSHKCPCYFFKKKQCTQRPFLLPFPRASSPSFFFLFCEPFFFSFFLLRASSTSFFLLPHSSASPFASLARGGCSSSAQAAASPSFECASSSILSRTTAFVISFFSGRSGHCYLHYCCTCMLLLSFDR